MTVITPERELLAVVFVRPREIVGRTAEQTRHAGHDHLSHVARACGFGGFGGVAVERVAHLRVDRTSGRFPSRFAEYRTYAESVVAAETGCTRTGEAGPRCARFAGPAGVGREAALLVKGRLRRSRSAGQQLAVRVTAGAMSAPRPSTQPLILRWPVTANG